MTEATETPTRASTESSREGLLQEARRVLRAEAEAVAALAERLDDTFSRAIEVLAGSDGRVICTGVGKSGIVARKVAATLTSTGTPAAFLHPVDGLHGDLGIVSPRDVGIFISKSGATSELHGLMEYMVRHGIPTIALTGRLDSPLARAATVALDCGVTVEACPLALAPTSSTTAALAMGDAIAMVLLMRKGFRVEDFARIHPGGTLGRGLTLRVAEVMVGKDFPKVSSSALIRDCIVPLARLRGTVPIVDGSGLLVGVVTTGDLTRLMEKSENFLDRPVREVMTPSPKTASAEELAGAAVHRMESHGIMALPVVDASGHLEGIVHLHDLLRAGAS